MIKLVLLASYLFLLPFVTLTLLTYAVFFVYSDTTQKAPDVSVSYQTITEAENDIAHVPVVEEEARVAVLTAFFQKYDSPLASHAEFIVDKADEYDIDWKLIPAIAMQESTLCKRTPKDSFNCWGYGIYGGKVMRFEGYEQAITAVTKSLATTYKAKGLHDPHEIVTRYTPGSTTWADKVTLVMSQIESAL